MQDAVRSVLAQTDRDFRLVVVDERQGAGTYPGLVRGARRRSGYATPATSGTSASTKNFQKLRRARPRRDYVVIMGCDDLLRPALPGDRARGSSAPTRASAMVQPGVEVIDGRGAQVTQGLADETKRRAVRAEGEGPGGLMAGEELAASVLRGNWLYFPSIAWRGAALRAGELPRRTTR